MIAYQQAREAHLERLSSDGWAGVRAIEQHIDGDDLNRDDRQTASRALGEFLRRIISPGDPMRTARRFAVFASIFSPELLGISFSKMSKPLGVTRSALSKMGLAIRAEFRLTSRGAKSERARSLYAAAQHRAVARGSHASMKRCDRRPRRKR